MRVIGHRGAAGLEPENTVRGFARARQVGVDGIELDLRVSADGQLVILHDADVDRTTDGTGPVAALTLDRIRELDAGSGERIPTFDEALDAIGDLPVQAELKASAATAPFAAAVARRGPALAERLTVTSFHDEMLDASRALAPGLPRALIVSEPVDVVARAAAVGADTVCLRLPHGGPADAERVRAAGLRLMVWPVNDTDRAELALELGAEGFTTDRPDLMQAYRRSPAAQPTDS